MSKRVREQQGYTLIEMIIVIAIIAVVAGMSILSVNLIHSARAKNASTTVDSEIASLITRSKNMQVVIDGKKRPELQFAARIYADDKGAYYFQKGYYDPKTKTYDFNNTDTEGEGKGMALSSSVVIKFTSDHYYFVSYAGGKWKEDAKPDNYSGSSVNEIELKSLNTNGEGNPGAGGLFLRFAKDGTCEAGAGDIGFYKRSGNIVAHVLVRTNGSHQSR